MRITLRSEEAPDAYLESTGEPCNLKRLEQHIRTLVAARNWLKRELRLKAEREKAAQKTEKK